MSKTIISGGCGKIKLIKYKGKPAIVKEIKINIPDLPKNLSVYISKIGATTKKRYSNPIIDSILSTEDEAKKMMDCRREVGDNIAEIYGYDKEKCEIYMKKYEGDLNNLKHSINLEEKYNIVLDIINGLHAMHSMKLIHADLKCSNVLYEYDKTEERNVAYITDFGISGFINEDIRGYSPAYCPKFDDKLTEKYDIYCLGKTLSEFFCNLSISQLTNLNYGNFPKFCTPESFGSKDFCNIVRKSLEDDPEERPDLIDFIPPVIPMIAGIPF